MSTEFKWNSRDFESMYSTCADDDAVKITIDYIKSKVSRVLEAGSGSGRVVKYLYDIGYKNIEGIELNRSAVKNFNKLFPEIKVIQGDILNMPYKSNYFDVIASYGVVEHFLPGLAEPLTAFKRILKPNGVLIVSVPSMNVIRRLIYLWDLSLDTIKFWEKTRRNRGIYYVHPQFGNYFEYRLTPREFRQACIKAGYQIIAEHPIYHLDGLYHIFGEKLIKYQNYKFYPSRFGSWLNRVLSKIRFAHNHMHLLVLRKQ